MSGDSKIGVQAVGGLVRTGATRRIASESAAAARPPVRVAAQDTLPVARLITMAGELAAQGPSVDVSRVAALRTAIAGGSYAPDAAAIARAMLAFQNGSGA